MRALRSLAAPPPSAQLAPGDAAIIPSDELGPLPKLAWVDKACFAVDDSYQREGGTRAGRKVIDRMVETFTWRKFQPPTVVQIEDGRYLAIDGQHRIVAALRHPVIRDIPCYIVEAPEIRDQADAFVAINRDRISLNSLQLHHAAVAAGSPLALRVQSVCDAAGVLIPRNIVSGPSKRPNHLLGVSSIGKLITEHNEVVVGQALKLIVESRCELRRGVIEAVVQMLIAYRRLGLDQEHLVRLLAKQNASQLEEAGRQYKREHPGSRTSGAVRMALVQRYNRGLPIERRLPERAA